MDRVSEEKRSEIMRNIKSSGTKPELKLFGILDSFGIDYIKNYSSLPGKPDAVMMHEMTAIFVHGCFWHCHAGCFKMPKSRQDFWVPKLERNVERDGEQCFALKEMGYRVITVWECQLKPKNIDRARAALGKMLGKSDKDLKIEVI